MIDPQSFITSLQKNGLDFFSGVPDSLLKDFCAYIDDHGEPNQHIIAANEGNALAMAVGYHLATGKNGVVYLQNSGLGNIINPLTSIADKEVYKIPMLLVVGWRGEPGVKDEPQHIKQGRITPAQLDLLEIPFRILDSNSSPQEISHWVRERLDSTNAPVALLVRKDTFIPYRSKRTSRIQSYLGREEAIRMLLKLAGDAAIISTTGKTSREVFEIRRENKQIQRDFFLVGGMGHTVSVALGVAIGNVNMRVVCLDGDGSLLMHMGALPIVGATSPNNFIHVLLNNGAHESVGGQPTVADKIDFQSIAIASGYKKYAVVRTKSELEAAWNAVADEDGPIFIEIQIALGSRDDLGRPSISPIENKMTFMRWTNRYNKC